ELDRIARIVDDLGAIARGASGADVVVGPVFAPDVLDELRRRVAGLGLEDVEIADPPPVVVRADEGRLAQSLLNLVVNARTHTPPGTRVRVTATVEDADGATDGGWQVLAVAEDRPGIDPAVRDRAFEPFVTTRASGRRSTGRGLPVVKTLTAAQGGTVELDTAPSGTTVRIRVRLDAWPRPPRRARPSPRVTGEIGRPRPAGGRPSLETRGWAAPSRSTRAPGPPRRRWPG